MGLEWTAGTKRWKASKATRGTLLGLPGAQMVENLPADAETCSMPGWEEPLEEGTGNHPVSLPGECYGHRRVALRGWQARLRGLRVRQD